MKYKCLILDHDDTIVDSTRTVNFPAFLDSLSKLRPGVTMTCEDYFKYNYKPGFTALCFDILKFTEEEMHIQEITGSLIFVIMHLSVLMAFMIYYGVM